MASIFLKNQKLYSYDTKGRATSISETIAGSGFSTSFTYDNLGRLSKCTHPSGIVETMGYNTYGYPALSDMYESLQPVVTICNWHLLGEDL